jgi:uncharacterized membrane protein YjgN (DUF898 family)
MEALRFTGSGSEYFKIWIVNVLLTIITLGIYYPWAKVRNRRYFYANSTLDNRNFEYHATGKQLFVGFLIAMVFFIVYNLVAQVSPQGTLLLLLVLFIAIPWLIWRSLMFNMRVSSFSNVYFSFTGKIGQAYLNYFVYPLFLIIAFYGAPIAMAVVAPSLMSGESASLMTLLSIVMFLSWIFAFYLFAVIKKRNTEYVINGSRYGQGVFETKVEAKKFLMINLKTMGLSVVVMLILGVIVGVLGGSDIMMLLSNPEAMKNGQIPEGFALIVGIAYFVMIFAMMLIMSYTISRQRAYIYENTLLDNNIAFASTLKARSLAWVMLSNFFLIILTLGLAFPWAKVRMARLMLENTLVDTEVGFDAYISQKQDEQSSLGEQIGDAFDVDVGVAF